MGEGVARNAASAELDILQKTKSSSPCGAAMKTRRQTLCSDINQKRLDSGCFSSIIMPVDGKASGESFTVRADSATHLRSAKKNATDACGLCATCCFLEKRHLGQGRGQGNWLTRRRSDGHMLSQRGDVGQLHPEAGGTGGPRDLGGTLGNPSRKLGQSRCAWSEYPPGLGVRCGGDRCHGNRAVRSRAAMERKLKAVAVSIQAVCLDGGREEDIEDGHRRREGGRDGGRGSGGLFQVADDDASHDLKI